MPREAEGEQATKIEFLRLKVGQELLLYSILDIIQPLLDFDLGVLDQESVFLNHVRIGGVQVLVYQLRGLPLYLPGLVVRIRVLFQQCLDDLLPEGHALEARRQKLIRRDQQRFDSPTGTARLLTNGFVAVEWEEQGVSLEGREIRQTTQPLVFGWAPTHPGTYMAGWLDEVRVWNRARFAAEIRAEMSCKLTGQEANFFGFWNFDDLTPADQTANGHKGAFSGDARALVRATDDMGLIGCDPALFLSGQNDAAELRWYLRGRIGSQYLIQSSTNLTTWDEHDSLPVNRGGIEFKAIPSGEKAFYRAVLTP